VRSFVGHTRGRRERPWNSWSSQSSSSWPSACTASCGHGPPTDITTRHRPGRFPTWWGQPRRRRRNLPPALHVRCLTTRPQEASCPPLRMPSWAAKSPRTPSPPPRNHWPTTNLRPNSADAVDCCSKVIPRCIPLPDRAGGCARHVEPSCSAASPPPPRRPPAAGRRHDLKSCRLTSHACGETVVCGGSRVGRPHSRRPRWQ
jgi:hypothetical protein